MLARALLLLALSTPLVASPFSDAVTRFERAEKSGFHWSAANPPSGTYTGKRAVTDDGPYGLPLLGGIGTGGFARDLTGHFNRWQLQPGFPRHVSVDAASLALRWEQAGRSGAFRVGEIGWDRPLPIGVRKVAVLWPVVSERLQSPEWPVEVVIESWSPVIPKDEEASALPVAFFDVYARNTSAQPATLDVALFMPNFLGWRKGFGSTVSAEPEPVAKPSGATRLGPRAWTDRSNSGNHAVPVAADPAHGLLTAVQFQRAGYVEPTQDLEGQVLLGVGGGESVRPQRVVTAFLTGGRNVPEPIAGCYLDRIETTFFNRGVLPPQERTWTAEANEVMASGVSGGLTLAPGAEGHFTLVVTWDLPLVQFGSGRTWEKAYTARYGADGRQARRLAVDALAHRQAWRDALDQWHAATLGTGSPDEQRRRGAAINDLYYVVAGGSVWVAKEHARPGFEPPLLGSGEHFSLLEGFDSGYYFTSTFDLWPYAQPAFEANWPHLAELLLNDFVRVTPLALDDPRFIMGTGTFTVRKLANKVPHDLGSPAGDPWHRVNEYGSARDTNVWKDHNPQFILSLYLHRKYAGNQPPTDAEWRMLLGVADFMVAQDKQHDGLPFHDAQGDNTWDVLHFTGPSPYSGALTIAAWAAMGDWARRRGDVEHARQFAERLALGQKSFEQYFWNGRYYRAAANGEQAEWVLGDALFGIALAEAAGLRDLLPREHMAAHLRQVAARNWREFGDGSVGPSLLAPATGPIPSGRMQVGEVLVGSARASVALMQRVGLAQLGGEMADALNHTLYETSGLQFRTPAAWTADRTFRAPSNMRPLASWYWLWPQRP